MISRVASAVLVEELVFVWLTLTDAELVALAFPVLMLLLDPAELAPAVGVGAGGRSASSAGGRYCRRGRGVAAIGVGVRIPGRRYCFGRSR